MFIRLKNCINNMDLFCLNKKHIVMEMLIIKIYKIFFFISKMFCVVIRK